MNPRLRVLIIVALGVGLGGVLGFGIANEHLLLSALVTGAILWVITEWINGPFPDAWVLAWAIFGYIVGNRGFAQFSLSSDLPLLPAEAALLVGVPLLIIRLARKKVVAVRRDLLNLSLLLWVLLGTARLPLDLRVYGFLGLRDFAMVYYAAFFFIAQALAGHPPSFRLLRQTLTAAFVVLPVVAAIDQIVPNFFLGLTIRNAPLIFYKNDLLAAMLGAGFFWLWTRWEKTRQGWWLAPATASILLLGTMTSARAAMVGMGVVTGIWLLARRWRVAVAQFVIVGAAVCVAVFLFALSNRNPRETAVYSTYERVVSIFDFQGTGTYVTVHESGDPGDNNRFRLVWWRAVTEETLAENPVFGLGFGHNLASRFLIEFGLVAADDFSARSPHSMLLSVLGRMGLLGLLLWLAVAMGMITLTRRIFRHGNFDSIGLICIGWVLWTSGCFGIVLEGPMGAVVFWTVLGLANVEEAPEEVPEIVVAAPADLQAMEPKDEVPASL